MRTSLCLVVEDLPWNAGDTGSILGGGPTNPCHRATKPMHAPHLLSLCALEPKASQLRAQVLQLLSRTPQLECPHPTVKDP